MPRLSKFKEVANESLEAEKRFASKVELLIHNFSHKSNLNFVSDEYNVSFSLDKFDANNYDLQVFGESCYKAGIESKVQLDKGLIKVKFFYPKFVYDWYQVANFLVKKGFVKSKS